MILSSPPIASLPQIRAEHLSSFGESIHRLFGLSQPARDKGTLGRRLLAAMEASGMPTDPDGFLLRLQTAKRGAPIVEVTANVVPNRETSFFRDVGQLRSFIQGPLAQSEGNQKIRVLSAGCATGEEAYSLAMLLVENNHHFWGREFHVDGIDVSAAAIDAARQGSYRPASIARSGEGPERWRDRYFRKEANGSSRVRSLLRSSVSFQRANLVDEATLRHLGAYDAVVCRNVLIYFDPDTLRDTVDRLVSMLRPGGVLLLGHAESGLVSHLDHCRRWIGDRVWFARQGDV